MTASTLFLQEKIASRAMVEQMEEGWRNGEMERRWKKDRGLMGKESKWNPALAYLDKMETRASPLNRKLLALGLCYAVILSYDEDNRRVGCRSN
jgi:hypothetical protein